MLTSLREIGGALEARIFNPWEQEIRARLSFEDWPAGKTRPVQMKRVDFESNPVGAFERADAPVTLKAKEIATLRLS